jgi:hypothetical protein
LRCDDTFHSSKIIFDWLSFLFPKKKKKEESGINRSDEEIKLKQKRREK